MSAPVLRPYRAGDEAGILELYRVVFSLRMPAEEWRWHYRFAQETEGHRSSSVIVVAEAAGGRIAGHYAVQPRPFSVNGRPCVAGLVMGSMVAPELRNITTFVDLARMAYGLCRERGMELVYAFPNDNVWLVRQRMLDWQALPSIAALAAPLEKLAVQAGDLSAVERLATGEPFPAVDWQEGRAAEGVRAVHAADWLAWRFLKRPGVEYTVYIHRAGGEARGYIALKRHEAEDGRALGHVVGWRVSPGEEETVGASLLARARAHFEQAGVQRVSLWLLPASPLHAVAIRAGLAPEPQRKNFGYLALDDALEASGVLQGNWDVMMAESDVF